MSPKTLLVTGVASGLGRAFAHAAIAAGHRVVGTVRRAEDVERCRSALGIDILALELREPETVRSVVELASASVGPIDVLVNNAGFGHEGAVEESPLDALRRQLDVNVIGQVALIQAVLPAMRARGSGHIVNVTSMAGSVGLPGVAFYCASKFAMEGLSEALGKELRPLGIHVTAFAPGQFRTDWAGRSLERTPRSIGDYDQVIDGLRSARRAKDGRQQGDPDRAARLLMQVVASPNPPPRVFVGPDALALARQKIKKMQAEIAGWEELSGATDFQVAAQ